MRNGTSNSNIPENKAIVAKLNSLPKKDTGLTDRQLGLEDKSILDYLKCNGTIAIIEENARKLKSPAASGSGRPTVVTNKFCPRDWFSHGDWDCYWPSHYKLSYVEATKQCNLRKATLLMFFSEVEYNKAIEIMTETGLMRKTWMRAGKLSWPKIKRTIDHGPLNMTINGIVYDYRVYLG